MAVSKLQIFEAFPSSNNALPHKNRNITDEDRDLPLISRAAF